MNFILAGDRKHRTAWLFTVSALLFGVGVRWHWQSVGAKAAATPGVAATPATEVKQQWSRSYGELPLRFEANQGQAADPMKFIARGNGYTLLLAPNEMVWRLRQSGSTTLPPLSHPSALPLTQPATAKPPAPTAALRMKLLGAQSNPRLIGLEQLKTRSNYLTGNDPRGWRTNVANYGRVKYETVYPGIDLVFYGAARQLEYDFVIAPGANAQQIKLAFAGARRLRLARDGDLILQLPGGELRQRKPVAYQLVNGQRKRIAAQYVVRRRTVTFQLGAYDRRQPLWIDPVLSYSTFFGGSESDEGLSIAVDGAGHAYIAGTTVSTDLIGAAQSQIQSTRNGNSTDAFVAKLNADGSALLYATYLGGESNDFAYGIAVDSNGNAAVTGLTSSSGFPTRNALQNTRKGINDAFVAKLNATGTALLYSSYLGGAGSDSGYGIATDAAGNTYIAGQTTSSDYPVVNAVQNTRRASTFFASTNGGGNWGMRGMPPGDNLKILVPDPLNAAVLYAAAGNTFSTQVYKSADRGAHWTATGINIPTDITALALDPSDPQFIYVGTANGIYKSVDGGGSASRITGPNVSVNFARIVPNPFSSATLYAVTPNGLLKSTTRGETWNVVSIFSNTNPPSALVFDPVTTATIYVAAQHGVYKSVNEGVDWQLLNPSAPYEVLDLALERGNPQTLYGIILFGANRFLIKSTNGGGTWSSASFPAGITPLTLLTDPNQAGVLYVITSQHGIYKSSNGGANWAAVNTGFPTLSVNSLIIDRLNSANLYAGVVSGTEAVISKLSADGSVLLYSTYLGGDGHEAALSIAVDANGSAYVGGLTDSVNFPVAPNSSGGTVFQSQLGGNADGFVTKLNPAGNALSFSSYFGGKARDTVNDLAVDNTGRVYLTGTTFSSDMPRVRPLPGLETLRGGVDGFVARVKADGAALDYSTYLGGNARDEARAIAIDSAGNVHLSGVTASTDFPLANALQAQNGQGNSGDDVFYSKLSADGTQLLVSTYLGGSAYDQGWGLALDGQNNVYLTGVTNSANFPTLNPLRTQPVQFDAFITKLGLQADLALTLTAAPKPVMVNNRLTYTLTVTNNGPDEALGVRLSDTLPAGVSNVQASASQGTCSGTATINCDLGTLPSQATATLTIAVTPAAIGTLRNTASVVSNTPEKDPANNLTTQETRVSDKPSIYGRVVTANGVGVPGVNLALSGGTMLTQPSDARGTYQFAQLTVGENYAVTPSLTGYVIRPAMGTFNDLRHDQVADFDATQCIYTIAPLNRVFQKAGGTGSVAVSLNDALCPWMARSTVPWIQLTAGISGSGNGTVSFTVAPTTTGRRGTLVIGERVFTVVQEADACGATNFATTRSFEVLWGQATNFGRRIYASDFNHDGRSDLLLVSPQQVHVMLNAGNGMFQTRRDFPAGINGANRINGLVIGDVNRDGKADLLVIGRNNSSNVVALLLGNGDGSFGEPRFVMTGEPLAPFLLEDVNHDGKLDLITASVNHVLLVALGNGDGTFGALIRSGGTSHSGPRALVAGYFNNDAHLDIAIAEPFAFGVLLGDGTGRFTLDEDKLIELSNVPSTLTAADFNRDGKTDLALAPDVLAGTEPNLNVYLSKGDSTFEAPRQAIVGAGPRQLLTGDFNGDSFTDLVTANAGAGDASFLPGLGNGNFGAAQHYSTGGKATALADGDFNGDQRPDIIIDANDISATGRSLRMALLLNSSSTGQSGFAAAPDWLLGFIPYSGVAGDFNNDGRTDVVLQSDAGQSKQVLVLGNAKGGFDAPLVTMTSAPYTLVEARDLNRDGRLDLIVQANNQISVLLGNGSGGFPQTAVLPFAPGLPSERAFSDFNNDGYLDAVALGQNGNPGLYLGAGGSGLTLALNFGEGLNLKRLTVGDFNGDGHPDIAAAALAGQTCGVSGGVFWLFYGNGRGGLSTGQRVVTDVAVSALRAEDLNSDGRADLAVLTLCGEQRLAVLLNNATSGFLKPELYQVTSGGAQLEELRFADFNSDGRPDILFNGPDTTGLTGINLLLNAGNGRFGVVQNLNGLKGYVFIPADFNDDGKTDLALGSGALTLLYNNCSPSGALANVSAASYSSARFAPEAIVAAFGNGLATMTQTAAMQPLPTTLAGTTVKVTDAFGIARLAPLFFVAPNQVNYLLPAGTAPGAALVTIINAAGTASTATLTIANIAPALFAADASGQGPAAAVVLRIKSGGAQSFEPVAEFNPALNRFVTRPIDLGPDLGAASDQVFLLLFGTGIRGRDTQQGQVSVIFDASSSPVEFAGAQGMLTGVDQVNVRLPRTLVGRGEIEATLFVDQQTSNKVRINIR